MRPRIAIVIATYNWPDALKLCVRSIFRQTIIPDEIIIADDGSTESTKQLIQTLASESPTQIKHIWHPDEGFRLSAIRNRAFAATEAEYIIQIDGDIILEKHFVEDHLHIAEKGCFVCGSRVFLQESESAHLIANGKTDPNIATGIRLSYILNCFRSKILRKILAARYGKNIAHMRGCNLAFWRKDLIQANGYDENLQGWGHEDQELVWRLHFAGVRKKFLKFGGICFHLYHEKASKDSEDKHNEAIKQTVKNKSTRCPNGMDKYLNGEA